MLRALAAERSTRRVIWLHTARDGQHHPFAGEVRQLMTALTNGRSYVCYSRPESADKAGENFNATGRFSRSVFDELGLPGDADVYLCGPNQFMTDMKETLTALGVAPERIHIEIFSGGESMTPGVVGAATRTPHRPSNEASTVLWCRLGGAGFRRTGTRRATRAFWSWLRRAMCRCDGRVERVFATTVRVDWSRGRSYTTRSRSTSPRMGIYLFAVRRRREIWLWICRRMVRLARVELATCCFGGNCSIQLSYSRTVFSVYSGSWGAAKELAWRGWAELWSARLLRGVVEFGGKAVASLPHSKIRPGVGWSGTTRNGEGVTMD